MKKQVEIRLTGSGGQGVILAAIILAEAALLAGYETAQSQSYGPEARGGLCKAEIIVSASKIGFPKVTEPSFLLALTQEALNKYSHGIFETCIVMADSSLSIPECLDPANVIHIPIIETARNTVGKAITANIVAIGAINTALRLVSDDCIRKATTAQVPKAMADVNLKALQAGKDLINDEDIRPVSFSEVKVCCHKE